MPPCEIVPALADKGTYIASESSFYRVLRDANEQHHRGRSDNGSPMKGATMLETLYKLGITPSNSRPRVSNDNPYAESLFKTLKYRPNYQPKGFENLGEARTWCANFVHWYRYEHHHSGIKFVTPSQRHSGEADRIVEKRHELYEQAKAAHPERWNGRPTRDWTLPEKVYLNPDREDGKTTINDQVESVSA